jgi:hypothetical protein
VHQQAKGTASAQRMKLAIKIWFCLAVAMIAASLADPLVEFASNSGWFGPGAFTDNSNWNVVPALLVGLLFVALHFYLRVRSHFAEAQKAELNWLKLASDALGARIRYLIPVIFAVQVLALYVIETSEQLVTYGHPLGGSIWLGGPIAASLTTHAVVCCVIALAVSWLVRALAAATIRLVTLVRAFAILQVREPRPNFLSRARRISAGRSTRVLCRIGERAPPFLIA